MANLALSAEGAILGLPCHILIQCRDNKANFSGTINACAADVADFLQKLGCESSTAQALSSACAQELLIGWQYQKDEIIFAAQCNGFSLSAIKAASSAFLLHVETKMLLSSNGALLQNAAKAAQLLCIEELYVKYGSGALPKSVTDCVGALLPCAAPQSFQSSKMLLYSRFNLRRIGAFGEGMRTLLGLDEVSFVAADTSRGFEAGLYVNELRAGDFVIKSLFCVICPGGFVISGELSFKSIGFILSCRVSVGAFMLSGYMPYGKEIDLGSGWRVTELALGIGFDKGITMSVLGRIYARRLMLFAALGFTALASAVRLNFLSAASSDLTLPNIVYSFTTAQISGLEAFDFIQITGFTLDGAALLSQEELTSGEAALAAGFNKVMQPSGLELKGSYKITKFGDEKILTDEGRMRNYTICPSGQVKLNPQFYYAPADYGSFGGYDIKKGAFFCGVLKIFNVSVKLFFQADNDGIMAYLNISPIHAGIFELTQSGFKGAKGVLKPAGGGMVSQFLSSDTSGPELFICMSKSQKCFYLDARLKIFSAICFDAHIVYADKLVSVDARFSFLSIFEVSFYLRADYSSFNSLNFEFALIADTSGLKRLLEAAINKIESAARDFNNKMSGALNSVNEARNSVNGLWNQISDFDSRIQSCKYRINDAPWYKKWYIAIGAGFEIGAYEIAKAGIYVAIGVAQAALAIAEGILRLAQAVGNVVLAAVKGFLQGLISLFYIERLAFAGVASSGGAALGVKMDFIALGKSYSTQGTLSLGGNGAEKCKSLLNGMVENETAQDVKSLNEASRSSKKIYRTASMQGHRELYSEGADYCRRTRAYMRDLQAAYASEYGRVMAEGEDMLMAVDGAVLSARQSSELVMKITDDMNFEAAFSEIEQKISTEPESRLSRSRSRSLEDLRQQWQSVSELKNALRDESGQINTQAGESVFKASTEKSQAVLNKGFVRDARSLHEINPDRMLNKAESLMYQKFSRSKSRHTFCPYREPVLLNTLDMSKTQTSSNESITKMRARHKGGTYTARL